MGWRTLFISKPSTLSLLHSALQLTVEEELYSIPIDDLACVVVESRHTTLTTPLIDALAASGASVFFCDAQHMPSSILLPYHAHSRQTRIAREQIAWTVPFQKRVWQRIIQAKITNQATLLHAYEPSSAKHLLALVKYVSSGDAQNIEAQAARHYFSSLFDAFTRSNQQDDIRNSALNYGYAIVRAMLARAVVGVGFLPTFGIHHDNELNAFNLVDDLIEPFRPFVDGIVKELIEADQESLPLFLPKHYKTALLELVVYPCRYGAIETTLGYACELSAQSLLRATRAKDATLIETVEWL